MRNLHLSKHTLLATLVLVNTWLTPLSAHAEIAIIVNAGNKEEINLDTVMRIYLGQAAKFASGDEANPVALPDGSRTRGELNLALLKAAPASIKSSWARQQFTGNLKPLPTYNTEDAVLKAVAETPNSIGYVDAAKVRGNVRVALKL
jgi:ABC-type phosphate transport system substrate-binding protein